MATTEDEHWMREAIAVATSRGDDPASAPIGCVIVLDGKIVGSSHNECETLHDATAHAEMVAFRKAGIAVTTQHNVGGEMRGATLYSTLQPCGMCTMASIWAKVERIVYGAGRDDVHKMYFEARGIDTLDFVTHAYRDDLSVEGGVLRAECAQLYYPPDADLDTDEQANL
ncbi:nucleoside deaminase [Glacieibacterium megasporae]|uniref:nucleoside deaminase n=1 Tax=Glacieibacterium megasporae TaxID=2835787 RepID=UPI001C1DF55A|nr:nucleoside deaminase [Polymorphobacter megasporae]UAJ12953.1 nucleoside deaminase [Polymorphobacter megasporae]